MERELFGLTVGGLAEAEEDVVEGMEGSDGVEARYGWLERLVAESAGVSQKSVCVCMSTVVDVVGWGLGMELRSIGR